jgi:phosphorylcholine metabolism protein LicD
LVVELDGFFIGIVGVYYNEKILYIIYIMAGDKQSNTKLNYTLLKIAQILNEHNINNWFVGYGTLLGIIRDSSCIDGDDDVDIISNYDDYDKIKSIFHTRGFTFCYEHGINNTKDILKTNETNEYSSVDFYMARIDPHGNYIDMWEKVVWSICYKDNKLIKLDWNGTALYIPNNYESKLINRYGDHWRIPQNNKGPYPRKMVI